MYFYLLLNLYLQIGSQQTFLNRKFIITHTLHCIQQLNVMKYGGVQSAMGLLCPIVTQSPIVRVQSPSPMGLHAEVRWFLFDFMRHD